MAEIRGGFSWASLAALVIGIIALFAIGWSALFKPTTSNKIADGGTQIINYDVPKVPIMGASCMRINAQLFWQTDPKTITGAKK